MNRCRYCENPIAETQSTNRASPVLAACNCRERGCCRCAGTVCVTCCISRSFRNHHTPATNDQNQVVCRHCRLKLIDTCDCCDNAYSDRCYGCCRLLGHACCITKKVKFVSGFAGLSAEPTFLIPANDKTLYTPLNRATSLNVLTRTLPLPPKVKAKIRSTRFASLEIEASNIKDATKLNEVIKAWGAAVVHDRTTGDYGFEINTTPACNVTLKDQTRAICEALVAGNATVSESCGLHVHVDCRDYGYQEIHRFIKVYKYLEPALFDMLHVTRHRNQFCKPCGSKYFENFVVDVKPDTKELKKAILPVIYGNRALGNGKGPGSFHQFRTDHYGRIDGERNPARYDAVNLHSYFLRGTIEFRMHHAAIDFPEVYGWAKLLVCLMDKIYSTPDTVIEKLISGSPKNAVGVTLLKALIPPNLFVYAEEKVTLVKMARALDPYLLPGNLFQNHRQGVEPNLNIASIFTSIE
jgi:hypothetical protein